TPCRRAGDRDPRRGAGRREGPAPRAACPRGDGAGAPVRGARPPAVRVRAGPGPRRARARHPGPVLGRGAVLVGARAAAELRRRGRGRHPRRAAAVGHGARRDLPREGRRAGRAARGAGGRARRRGRGLLRRPTGARPAAALRGRDGHAGHGRGRLRLRGAVRSPAESGHTIADAAAPPARSCADLSHARLRGWSRGPCWGRVVLGRAPRRVRHPVPRPRSVPVPPPAGGCMSTPPNRSGHAPPVASGPESTSSTGTRVLGAAALVGLALSVVYGLFVSPPDAQLGETIRMIYTHVPTVSVAYVAFIVTAVSSAMYLWKRTEFWDLLGASSAEIGVVFFVLTILNGALWGKTTWGVFWRWEPRLTTSAVLLLMYIGYLAVRAVPADTRVRATRCAIVGLVAVVNIPIVHKAVDWWRGLHQ